MWPAVSCLLDRVVVRASPPTAVMVCSFDLHAAIPEPNWGKESCFCSQLLLPYGIAMSHLYFLNVMLLLSLLGFYSHSEIAMVLRQKRQEQEK